jgi:diadenylate cyclase
MDALKFDSLILDLVDIAIVTYLIYRGLLLVRGTRAQPMLWGLTVVVLLYFVSRQLGLLTLGWVLAQLLSSIILVVVVIFQDEIRRGLTKVGLQPIFRGAGRQYFDKVIEDLTLVASRLSEDRIGALIVVQREVGLDDFLEDAVLLDAQLNRKLLYGIFVKDSPLHDGAVIIEGERIKAANAVLPLSFDPDLDPNLGTRHRAALGLSERSDAVVVVVSEETGSISLIRDGKITRNLDAAMLREQLQRLISSKNKNGGNNER